MRNNDNTYGINRQREKNTKPCQYGISAKAKRAKRLMKKMVVPSALICALILSSCAQGTTSTTPETQSPAPQATTEVNPVSLEALSQKEFKGSDLKLEKVLGENDKFTRYFIKYKSGELTISGIMNVPNGEGPFPTLVLAHGYIDPKIYTTGRGLAREQNI